VLALGQRLRQRHLSQGGPGPPGDLPHRAGDGEVGAQRVLLEARSPRRKSSWAGRRARRTARSGSSGENGRKAMPCSWQESPRQHTAPASGCTAVLRTTTRCSPRLSSRAACYCDFCSDRTRAGSMTPTRTLRLSRLRRMGARCWRTSPEDGPPVRNAHGWSTPAEIGLCSRGRGHHHRVQPGEHACHRARIAQVYSAFFASGPHPPMFVRCLKARWAMPPTRTMARCR